VFEFFRNDKLDATNFFTNLAGQRKNPYGAINSVERSAALFSGQNILLRNYEGLRERRGATLLGLLPSSQWLAGNFGGTTVLDRRTKNHLPATSFQPADFPIRSGR